MYDDTFKLQIGAYITSHITLVQPLDSRIITQHSHLNGLQLSDPNFTKTSEIDLLIGATTFAHLIESGLVHGQPNKPIAQKTKLGWVVSGGYKSKDSLDETTETPIVGLNQMSNTDLSEQLKQFWEVEEITSPKQ